MTSLKTLREVQALNGKLSKIRRFLAKSTERSLPFFKTLKGCLNKKDFWWNAEAKAFQELKSHLQSLPALTVPKPEETLILYLATATEAISVVFLTEIGHVQKPIYFVSRALQGSKINYPNLEKVALALVHAARRKVLLKPENSGRIAKWAIEIGEHEILYKPRSTIKGQILADFLAESPTVKGLHVENVISMPGKSTSAWTLFTDGASSIEGSGTGLILTDPNGQEMTYALRFNFKASNNEAEYEALVAGLELTIQMEA
ncbi:reverse transcriptase domain-containing protein [Tanacetum coccineum]|uniref:Reverse transcriptase domain-containing protein n=1 Tax=Tanacetum coccineum TaxID=301880 RepID=A0ABQ5DU92_9ASTR